MISSYPIGSRVKLSFTVVDVNSAAADPTTGPVAQIRTPDGTITTYTYPTDAALVKDSTGNYHVNYDTVQEGLHKFRASGSGANNAGASADYLFEVLESEFV